jgi:hypothetical protein
MDGTGGGACASTGPARRWMFAEHGSQQRQLARVWQSAATPRAVSRNAAAACSAARRIGHELAIGGAGQAGEWMMTTREGCRVRAKRRHAVPLLLGGRRAVAASPARGTAAAQACVPRRAARARAAAAPAPARACWRGVRATTASCLTARSISCSRSTHKGDASASSLLSVPQGSTCNGVATPDRPSRSSAHTPVIRVHREIALPASACRCVRPSAALAWARDVHEVAA